MAASWIIERKKWQSEVTTAFQEGPFHENEHRGVLGYAEEDRSLRTVNSFSTTENEGFENWIIQVGKRHTYIHKHAHTHAYTKKKTRREDVSDTYDAPLLVPYPQLPLLSLMCMVAIF